MKDQADELVRGSVILPRSMWARLERDGKDAERKISPQLRHELRRLWAMGAITTATPVEPSPRPQGARAPAKAAAPTRGKPVVRRANEPVAPEPEEAGTPFKPLVQAHRVPTRLGEGVMTYINTGDGLKRR